MRIRPLACELASQLVAPLGVASIAVVAACGALATVITSASPAACAPSAEVAPTAESVRDGLARAAALERRWSGELVGTISELVWITGELAWFVEQCGDEVGAEGGSRQRALGQRWILVDAARGVREPLFDHERAAAALSARLGQPCTATGLPIRSLALVPPAGHVDALRFVISVRGLEKPLTLFRTGAVADADEATVAALRSPLLPGRGRSLGQGAATSVRFTNQAREPIQILWIDTRGEEHPYATIAPGDSHLQPTYAGHAWLVLDAHQQPLGHVVANDSPKDVVIADLAPAATDRDAVPAPPGISPNGAYVASIDHDNLVITARDGGVVFRTDDSTPITGYANPVLWSPDSSKLVVMRETRTEARRIATVESSPRDQLQPRVRELEYRKPGDPINQAKPCLFDIVNRRALPIDDALFPNPWSIDNLRWSRDSSGFYFLYNQRGHQVMRIVRVNATTGATTTIVNEECKTFFDYAGKLYLRFLDETNDLLWMSERDGWNHLFLIDASSGAVKRELTRGPWVVRGVEAFDDAKRELILRVSGIHADQDPYHVHFVRVALDRDETTVLTVGDGTHRIEWSPDRRYFVDVWSRVDQPPVTELRRADGSSVCELARASTSVLERNRWRAPQRFEAKGRDNVTDIWGVIWRPSDFDPAKRYAVIEDIYAGPQDSFVPKSFATWHRQRELAELGFIVVQIDGMGTSNRSKAFHDVCWKNLRDAGFPDRVLWLKAAAAKFPEMDLTRVGIYGGSAGGQNALRGMLDHPKMYKACVADCGCHDNRMDKMWWNELWMGWPVDDSYAKSSNVIDANKLEGKLLLVVGELDNNVDPASTMQVVDALVKADKDFELLVIPGAGHGCAETPYGRRRRAEFFVRTLGAPSTNSSASNQNSR